jgi:hypothetical protein
MIEPQPSFSFSFGDIMIEKTPYPHVGEIVHFIVHAFGLFFQIKVWPYIAHQTLGVGQL